MTGLGEGFLQPPALLESSGSPQLAGSVDWPQAAVPLSTDCPAMLLLPPHIPGPGGGRERERQRERQGEREREGERETGRERETEKGRERGRERDGEKERERENRDLK